MRPAHPPNTPSVTLRLKHAYGRELIYPACPISTLLARLTRKRTLDRADVATIRELGYEITWEDDDDRMERP